MREICIITNYFPPETGAASNRIFHLAKGLTKKGYEVTIITPLPNYPHGKIFEEFKGFFSHHSEFEGIKVKRLWLYASNSKNKLKRLLAMLSYSLSLLWYFLWNKIPNTVIVQSPPLLVAATCMFFLRSKKRKLILNVSDLWPLAGLELGFLKTGSYYNLLKRIEKFNYQQADLVLGQSKEILTHVNNLFPNKKTFLYRNFPVFEIPKTQTIKNSEKLTVVYAGLLGVAQGIFEVCKRLDYSNIEFHIYGSGAESKEIQGYLRARPDLDVIFHGQLNREDLHKELPQYDLALIPLVSRIYGSVPSKIFEYARLGLPMVYFGGGEGESIIEKHHLGWVVTPADYQSLNELLKSIPKPTQEMRNEILNSAAKHFDFDRQFEKLISVVQ